MEMDEEGASDESSDSESKSKARRSPRVREPDSSDDEDVSQATGMGIGAGIGRRSQAAAAPGFQQRPPSINREASLMHGGIGSSRRHEADVQAENSLHPPDLAHAFPASFGARATPPPQTRRQQSAFKGRQTAAAATPPPQAANIPAEDMRHLQSISSSFGARLLAKQGWVAGKGLGLQEDGKAVPIQANLNLSGKQGIGKGVRTEQSKREARERGEKFSSDEEEEKRKARKSKAKEKKRGGDQHAGLGEGANWRKNKNVKIKVEHKTYDQLLAEAGQAGQYAGVGPILDARGGDVSHVTLTDLSTCSR
jgi:tuftelin-interacting protein 11